MIEVYRNLIVPTAHVALARRITETLAPVGGFGMWVSGVSHDGNPPREYWFSTGFIDPDFAALLPLNGEGGHPEMILQMCEAAGLTVDLAEVEALLSAADITTETQAEAWARLNVQLVTDPEPEPEPFRPS